MQSNTYLKVYRSLLGWEWYTDINTKTLFLHCLLRANYKDRQWRGMDLRQGEFVTSIDHLAHETGLSFQQVRTALKKLRKTGDITYRTTNKYHLINVENYIKYQNGDSEVNKQTNKQSNKETTNKKQTKNKQVTTDNKRKNIKNINIINKIREHYNEVVGTEWKEGDGVFETYVNTLLEQGHSFEDFQTVINLKSSEVLGTKNSFILAPDKLFKVNNFKTYLNQPSAAGGGAGAAAEKKVKKNTFIDFPQAHKGKSEEELEKMGMSMEDFFLADEA